MDSGEDSPIFGSATAEKSGKDTYDGSKGEENVPPLDGLSVTTDTGETSNVKHDEFGDFQPFSDSKEEQQGRRVQRRRCSSVSRMSIGDTSSRELQGRLGPFSIISFSWVQVGISVYYVEVVILLSCLLNVQAAIPRALPSSAVEEYRWEGHEGNISRDFRRRMRPRYAHTDMPCVLSFYLVGASRAGANFQLSAPSTTAFPHPAHAG